MLTADTPKGTGPMTLDQGLASLKAKMVEKKVTVDDQAPKLDDYGYEVEEDQVSEPIEALESDQEENAEVSETESEAEQPEPSEGKIILPDGSEITHEEARKGYLRQSEFTRKTQALAQEREALAAREQAAVQQLSGLYQQLASFQEREPDWLTLSQEKSPEEYQRIQAYWRQKQDVMGRARQVIQQQQANAMAVERAKALEVLSSGEYEPTWKNEKSLGAGLETVSKYLMENYRTLDDSLLSQIVNPEYIIIADKARRFDELQKAKPRAQLAVKGKPAPIKPGAKSAASLQSEQLRTLTEAYRKNPSLENAMALEKAKSASRRPK